MPTQTASALIVVPPVGTQDQMTPVQMKNIITAPKILDDMIENLQREEDKAEDEFYKSLANDLANAALSVGAIDKYQTFQAKKEALVAKEEAAKELQPFLQRLIDDLKVTQSDRLKSVIRNELARLQGEAEVEKEKAELLKEQIESLKALLDELEKPARTAAKRKKE
jgi:hypothetical protein